MRILVLRNEPPWPLHYGGRLHSYELCRRLASRHELLLLAESGGDEPFPDLPFPCRVAGSEPFNRIHLGRIEQYLGVDEAYLASVLATVAAWKPDIVLGMSYRSASCLKRISDAATVWDPHDDEVLHRLRELLYGRLTDKRHDLKALCAAIAYERAVARGIDAISMVSQADALMCRRITGHHRVVCIPHGVDCNHFTPAAASDQEDRIVFWGGLTFAPNVSAILHFAEKVWPRVLQRRPGTRWSIVGWGDAPQLDRVRLMPGVRFHGYVPDIRPVVSRAALAVVPMVSGAGIKNKIMEAWAMGVPVLCTPRALGDLPGNHGDNVWLARRPREMADAVVHLLSKPDLRRELGSRGRRTAVQRCSWDRAAEQLESLCRELVCARRSPRVHEAGEAARLEEAITHAAS